MSYVSKFLAPLSRTPQLAIVLAMIALVMSGNGLVAPVLSLYASTFAASSTLVGLMITLFGVGRLLANMPAGILSQRFGRRPLLIIGPAIIVAGSIGAALATDFNLLLVWRFVQGVGSGIYMTTTAAMLADLSTDHDRGRVMALYQGGMLLGAGLGPAIGGAIAQHFGLAAPFWAYAVVCALALLVAIASSGGPSSHAAVDGGEDDLSVPGTTLLGDRIFLSICLVNFGVFFTRTASQWYLIPLLGHDTYGLRLDTLGVALALTAVFNFLMLPLVGGLIDRWGARSITIWSSLVTGFALAILAVGGETGFGLPSFWVGMAILGIGSGLNGPAVATYAASRMPRHLYGPAMGLLRSFGDLGFILGPIAVGFIADLGAGHDSGLLFNAVLVLVSAAIFHLWSSRRTSDAPAE